MKVKGLKDKILIAELDPEKDYICLVNPAYVQSNSLKLVKLIRKRDIPIVLVANVNKAVRFIEVPKPKKK